MADCIFCKMDSTKALLASGSDITISITEPDRIDITSKYSGFRTFIPGRRPDARLIVNNLTVVGTTERERIRKREEIMGFSRIECTIFENGVQMASCSVAAISIDINTNLDINTATFIILDAIMHDENDNINIVSDGWHIPTKEDFRTAERSTHSGGKKSAPIKRGFKIIP